MKIVSGIVGTILTDIQFGKARSKSAMRRWLITNGLFFTYPVTNEKSNIWHISKGYLFYTRHMFASR